MKSAKNCKHRKVGVNERGYRVGEYHHRAKLSDAQCDELLLLREETRPDGSHVWSYGALARRFQVSKSTVRDIVKGNHRVQYPVAWRSVPARADNPQPAADNPPHEPGAEVHTGGP